MTENTATRAERRAADRKRTGKRGTIAAVALATLAITGIGAAATSAAWTDNTLFSGGAQAATFDLQGSIDGTTWKQSDNPASVELAIPASTFANLLPGQTRTIDLRVKNLGSVSAALSATAVFASGSTFTTNPTVALSGLATTLTPAAGATPSDTFTLTVTTPDDWAATNQGKSGIVLVTIAGTATA